MEKVCLEGRSFRVEEVSNGLFEYFADKLEAYEHRTSNLGIMHIATLGKTLVFVMRYANRENPRDVYSVYYVYASGERKIQRGNLHYSILKKAALPTAEYIGKYMYCRTDKFRISIGLVQQDKPCQSEEDALKMAEAYCLCSQEKTYQNLFWRAEKELPIEAKIDGESCYLAFVEQHSGEALKITDKCGKYRVYPKN